MTCFKLLRDSKQLFQNSNSLAERKHTRHQKNTLRDMKKQQKKHEKTKNWNKKTKPKTLPYLVGGFNPFEKYESTWIISPSRDGNKNYLKPPPSYSWWLPKSTVPSDHNDLTTDIKALQALHVPSCQAQPTWEELKEKVMPTSQKD